LGKVFGSEFQYFIFAVENIEKMVLQQVFRACCTPESINEWLSRWFSHAGLSL